LKKKKTNAKSIVKNFSEKYLKISDFIEHIWLNKVSFGRRLDPTIIDIEEQNELIISCLEKLMHST
jgi:hypothetical protein